MVEVCAPASYQEEEFGGDSNALNILKKILPKFVYELLEFSYTFFDFIKLYRAARKFKPDFIYERYNLFLPSGIWVKKIIKKPLLLEINAPLFEERSKYGGLSIKWLARWTEHYVWRNADQLFVVTNVLAECVKKIGINDARITVTPNGVDLEEYNFTHKKVDAKYDLSLGNLLVLGFVGFIREWHGLERVIEVISENNNIDCIFYVIGEGPGKKKLEIQAIERNVEDKVKFVGLIERESIIKHIYAFDIALQPDVVAYASPLKLFEYMACSCAIIAPDSENIKEVLRHEDNALLFDSNNPNDFACAIERLIKDQNLANKISENARKTIDMRPYTWEFNATCVIDAAKKLTIT